MQELIDQFSIEKVGKSGSKFDPDKAKWFNHQFLMKAENADVLKMIEIILCH